MKKVLKRFRHYQELRKKEKRGLTPTEELLLLRLGAIRPSNKYIFFLCEKIKNNYFFCEEDKPNFITQTFRSKDIFSLLRCGDEELICNCRLLEKWNAYLSHIVTLKLHYQSEKGKLDEHIASQDENGKEQFLSGYLSILDERLARKELQEFLPSAKVIARAKELNLPHVLTTYELLKRKTSKTWHIVFKKDY